MLPSGPVRERCGCDELYPATRRIFLNVQESAQVGSRLRKLRRHDPYGPMDAPVVPTTLRFPLLLSRGAGAMSCTAWDCQPTEH